MHNTVKFLNGTSPTGYVTSLSACFSGRLGDEFITDDCGFYFDEVIAGSFFMFKFCTLSVPSCARVKTQMTTAECKITKDLANLRIKCRTCHHESKNFPDFEVNIANNNIA